MIEMKTKKKIKWNYKKSLVLIAASFILIPCFVFSLIKISTDIKKEQQMVESIAQQCDALEAENAELEAMLESGDKDAYIERVARENGYVKPNERVYVDISADE